MPKFQKEFPKNAAKYFSPGYDRKLRRDRPGAYTVLVICGLVGVMLPVCILMWVLLRYPAPNSGLILVAGMGAFIIGVGIFNIVAAFAGQYLGHKVTIGCFLVGGVIATLACVILYTPELYAFFDETKTDLYLMTLLMMCVPPIVYVMFRFSVNSWLRRKKISKTRINRLKNGKRNFWWYEQINELYHLGILYHLNKFVTVVYPAALACAFFLGWSGIFAPLVSLLYALLSLACAGMIVFNTVQSNMDEYGVPVVLFRRSASKRIDSVLDFLFAAFPLVAAGVQIAMTVGAFGT